MAQIIHYNYKESLALKSFAKKSSYSKSTDQVTIFPPFVTMSYKPCRGLSPKRLKLTVPLTFNKNFFYSFIINKETISESNN